QQSPTAHTTDVATMGADRARVTNGKAQVPGGAGMIDNAKVQLSYTAIRSPIDGRTGNLLIHQGNVVKANDVGNPMVVINRVHPIYVAFAVPEQELTRIKRYRANGTLRVEAIPSGPAAEPVRGDLS